MGLEYGKTHQCVKCGCTYPVQRLKVARRIDDVLLVNETVWICIDDKACMKMKLERAALLQRKGARLFTPEGSVKDPLKLPEPVRRSKKTLQFFPLHDSPAARRAKKRSAKKSTVDWGDQLNGRDEGARAKVPKE